MSAIPGSPEGGTSVQEEVSLTEVLRLLIKHILRKLNLQTILFLLSFLTFGVADGISAAYMMEKRGVIGEANPLIRFMYASRGSIGVIEIKIWMVIMVLSFVWNISRGKDNYWMINGFLFALFVGGLMATGANLMAARGLEHPAPGTIIIIYLFMTMLLTTLGDEMDRLHL
jgi:hypothetical protein